MAGCRTGSRPRRVTSTTRDLTTNSTFAALENAAQDIPARRGHEDVRVGAYELYRSGGGGKKDMSCACHWAVNQAATDAAGTMWGHAYSVLPSGIYVAGGLRRSAGPRSWPESR